jgi:hypothetical protein
LVRLATGRVPWLLLLPGLSCPGLQDKDPSSKEKSSKSKSDSKDKGDSKDKKEKKVRVCVCSVGQH